MRAYCLNNISKKALASLDKEMITDDINDANCILLRSYKMHGMKLNKNILAVARCGAGVNNIPIEDYSKEGVVVFNTPGANANAVKELVLCALFLSSRDIIGGLKYIEHNTEDENISVSAEKEKAKYAGIEIKGKTIAVIGLGVIGVMVANACKSLGMHVIGYDPYLSIHNAMSLSKEVKYVEKIEEAISVADFVTIHVPLNASTNYMFNEKMFNLFKENTILLNFSRDALVNDDDLLKAIENKKVLKYVTDFANNQVVKLPNTICLPHLGASTQEAEDNCAIMAIEELKDYLYNGNIKNSVNFPDCNAGLKCGKYRLCINHKNISGMIAKFSTVISNDNGNIENLVNKSKGEYAYSVIDISGEFNISDIEEIDGVLKVRVI